MNIYILLIWIALLFISIILYYFIMIKLFNNNITLGGVGGKKPTEFTKKTGTIFKTVVNSIKSIGVFLRENVMQALQEVTYSNSINPNKMIKVDSFDNMNLINYIEQIDDKYFHFNLFILILKISNENM